MTDSLRWSTAIEIARRDVVARVLRRLLRAGAEGTAPLPRTGIHRVLVCRNVHTLGDSLTLTPLLTELAGAYPGAEVDVVSGCPAAADLYGNLPNVRSVLPLPRHVAGHPIATARVLGTVRRKRYDLVIDPDLQSQSGRLLALWARAARSLGYVGARKSGTLTHGVAIPERLRHKAKAPVYLLRRGLGEDPTARPWPQPGLMLTGPEIARGRAILTRLVDHAPPAGARGPCIGIFANATGDKLLAASWWRPFLDALQDLAPGSRIVEILPASGTSLLEDRFPCFFSSDIRRLAALLANLDGCVSADCGVMHLAWAAGTPTVGLFTCTDPEEWGPFGPRCGFLRTAGASPADAARRSIGLLGMGDGGN